MAKIQNTSSIEDQLTLGYEGVPVEKGRMNSYEVATYIIAFSDFLGVISRKSYGEKIIINTEIQGFKKGSFEIDFAFQIAIITGMLFSQAPFSIKDFSILIKDCIKAWLHLGGSPPKTITQDSNNKNNYHLENNKGKIIIINNDVLNIITDNKAAEAVEQFIKKPLETGLSGLYLNSHKEGEIAKIEMKDAPSFVPISVEKPNIFEQEIQMTLLVESLTFKEGNKWKFSDGQSSFYADITDEEFIKKVDSGERFGKGDQLIANVRFIQSGAFNSLKLERSIIKVLEHKIPQEKQYRMIRVGD